MKNLPRITAIVIFIALYIACHFTDDVLGLALLCMIDCLVVFWYLALVLATNSFTPWNKSKEE